MSAARLVKYVKWRGSEPTARQQVCVAPVALHAELALGGRTAIVRLRGTRAPPCYNVPLSAPSQYGTGDIMGRRGLYLTGALVGCAWWAWRNVRPEAFPAKLHMVRTYYVEAIGRAPLHVVRYLLLDREIDNYTYEIGNLGELGAFLS